MANGNARSANPMIFGLTTSSNQANVPKSGTTYQTPSQNGADYSVWGQIGNWFTGQNTEAENYTSAENQALAEERERQFNAAQAELSRNWSSEEAAKEREFSASEAEKAREWTAHSYERMVKDAEAAGINPLYLIGASANTGTYAGTANSAPTGQTARSGSGEAPNMKSEKGANNILGFLGKLALTAAKIAIFKTKAGGEAQLTAAKKDYYESAAAFQRRKTATWK